MTPLNSDAPRTREELIQKARAENKWIHCSYQDLWWTPSELENALAYGRFQWGVQNFQLKSANERLEYLGRKVQDAQEDLDRFKKRMESYS